MKTVTFENAQWRKVKQMQPKSQNMLKIEPKTMLKTEPQRYEAYERKEEERRDLASDYLQVQFLNGGPSRSVCVNISTIRPPWAPL